MTGRPILVTAIILIVLAIGGVLWIAGSGGNLGRGGDEANPPPHAIQR